MFRQAAVPGAGLKHTLMRQFAKDPFSPRSPGTAGPVTMEGTPPQDYPWRKTVEDMSLGLRPPRLQPLLRLSARLQLVPLLPTDVPWGLRPS